MQARGSGWRWHSLAQQLLFGGAGDAGLPGEASITLVPTTHIHTHTHTNETLTQTHKTSF